MRGEKDLFDDKKNLFVVKKDLFDDKKGGSGAIV
jgi:hypothetical protein